MSRINGMSPTHTPALGRRSLSLCGCGRAVRWNHTTKRLEHKR